MFFSPNALGRGTQYFLYGADGVVYRRKHDAVAHWHFDEGDGTIAHDVDGANHGTLGGGEVDKVPAWSFGCGLLFDGIDDLVKVPDSDGLDLVGDKLTIAGWVNRSSTGSGYLVKKSDASNGYQLWITATGTVQFDLLFSGTTKTVTSTTTIPVNQWKHITARYNGTELRIFIDGTIESVTTAATGSLSATTEPLWLGYYDAMDHHLHGHLDDLSIYDRALSDSEITDLVNDVDKRYEYHHLNALGSNIVLTDDNQNVLVRYEYDVFGAIRNETGTSDNTRKFTGKEFDADSNLYYYAARYYDPYIGRFTQRDPIGDGVNWYAYAENNPLKYTDPTGQFVIAIPAVILVGGPAITVVKVGSAVVVGAAVGWWLADQTSSSDSPSESDSESDSDDYDSIDDFIDSATEGEKTTGRTEQYEKASAPGESAWDKANDDFDRLVKDLGGDGPKTNEKDPDIRSSTLPDGTRIGVRRVGSGKNPRPTIQIDGPKGGPPSSQIKVRYNTSGG